MSTRDDRLPSCLVYHAHFAEDDLGSLLGYEGEAVRKM